MGETLGVLVMVMGICFAVGAGALWFIVKHVGKPYPPDPEDSYWKTRWQVALDLGEEIETELDELREAAKPFVITDRQIEPGAKYQMITTNEQLQRLEDALRGKK